MSSRKVFIDEKNYRLFRGADWPSYQDFIDENYTVNKKLEKEIDNFILQMQENYNNLVNPKTETLSKANQQRQNQTFYNKQYFGKHCNIPWNTLGVNANGNVFICQSPSWIPIFVGNILEQDNIFDILNSDSALKIRQEILSNRYYYCNSKICGFFAEIDSNKFSKNPIDTNPLELIKTSELYVNQIPSSLIFDFDYTCNFKCPSCRIEHLNWNNHHIIRPVNNQLVKKIKEQIIDKIENQEVNIRWAGGEPFMSEVYLELLEYIISKGKRNIQNIIQTNGSLLIAKQDLVKQLLPYITEIRISFDAGSADVYNVTRIGGNWENLIENVKFLVKYVNENNIQTKILADFVVQKNNYKDLPNYVALCNELGIEVNKTQKMWNWGTWNTELFNDMDVYNTDHPLYEDVKKYFIMANLPIAKN
jgi:MoaA/NifB/PqqE/SkfB family radical SAM enzyme